MLKDFYEFIIAERKWWLAPLIFVLLIVGGLIVVAGSTPAGAFIYTFF